MTKTITTLLAFLLSTIALAQKPAEVDLEGAPPGFQLITQKDLLAQATFLASDDLKGRLTGSPGQFEAAKFIEGHFKSLGLEPLGDKAKGKRTYIQKYPVQRTYLDPKKTSVKIGSKTFKEGFLVFPAKGAPKSVSAKGSLALGGRIGGAGGKVDLGGLKGKVPVVFLRPRKGGGNLGVEGQFGLAFSVMGRMKGRASQCAKAGASAVLFCVLNDNDPLTSALTYLGLCPGKDLLAFKGDEGMAGQMKGLRTEIPWVVCSSKITEAVLKQMKLESQDVLASMDSDLVASVKKAKGKGHLKITIKVDKKAYATNVVAVLRGSDPSLKNQAVVYSAHMDHIGFRLDGDVFNGADDNASGTSGLMSIAKAFAKGGKPPKRSVIFLAVSGEEMGLWGSKYYSDHPTWPLAQIVANVNTDMIGRSGSESGPDEVSITPSYRHGKFSTMVRTAAVLAKKLGLGLTSGDKYYARSDHYNFAQKGIPVVFFCSGEHPDYHQVTDHADKLDGNKMERLARLAYWTGWEVATQSKRPKTVGRSAGWTEGQ